MPANLLAEDLDQILAQTRELWDEVRNQRLFITGGTGFFGCWLLESFAWANDRLKLNAELVVLTRNPEKFRQKAPHLAARSDIQFHAGDVRDFEFPAGPFSHVIHAATEASAKLNEENPGLMLDTTVTGTRRALEFAVHCGAKKFLLTSSGAVYGTLPPGMTHVNEDYPGGPNPVNTTAAYGEGKRMSELLCAISAKMHGLEVKIARCFAFLGPHLPLDAHYAAGNFIRDGMKGGPIRVGGDGTPYRSYLYASDLAIWLWTILFRGQSLRAYNVGSGQALTIAELARSTAAVCGGVEVQIARKPEPGKPVQHYVPDVSRAKMDLALEQVIGLEEGIRRTVRWHRERGRIAAL